MPTGIYLRTEYHKEILRKNGFKKGEKKLPFSEKHKRNISLALKGQPPWDKGKKRPEMTGKLHPLWKGENVSYVGLHTWVKRWLGEPTTCEHCGRTNLSGRLIHWANKSHQYKRDLTDWLRLCKKCHIEYDSNKNQLALTK